MFRLGIKHMRFLLVLGAAFALVACKKSENYGTDTGMAKDTGMAAAKADTGMAAAAPAALTDANIVYILDNANMLDSATGYTAATKGTSKEVRDYAKMMMRDHHSLRAQGQALAKKLSVTPQAPANDDSKAQYDKATSMLTSAAKGKDFDKAYIDDQVEYHKNLLSTATAAMGAAQNAELKNFIQKAAPAVQAHLDAAQAIQKKMM